MSCVCNLDYFQKSAARVYYNTHVKVNDRRIKYGVIAEEDLMVRLRLYIDSLKLSKFNYSII